MRLTTIRVSLIAICALLLISDTGTVRAQAQVQPGANNAPRTTIGGCTVDFHRASSWRDWMPIVSQPGPDGGSRLMTSMLMTATDANGNGCQLRPRSVRVPGHGTLSGIEMRGRNMNAWNGAVAPGRQQHFELVARHGPYVPVGTNIVIVIEWTDDRSGVRAVTSTPPHHVRRTM